MVAWQVHYPLISHTPLCVCVRTCTYAFHLHNSHVKGILLLSLLGDGKIEAQESQVTWLKLGNRCALGLSVQPKEAG